MALPLLSVGGILTRAWHPDHVNQSWADFPLTNFRPPGATHWQFPDNGWFVIFLWAAGPEWVVTTEDRTTRDPVRIACERSDGTVDHREEPFTDDDQTIVDDVLDEDLSQVGLPARPRGRDWYLRIDRGQRKDVMDRIGARVEETLPEGIDGEAYLPAVRHAMEAVVREELLAGLQRSQGPAQH